MMRRRLLVQVIALVTGCSHGAANAPAGDASALDDSLPNGGDAEVGPCFEVDDAGAIGLATATAADDYALSFSASSASDTSWSEAGNEALILEVSGARGLIGHVILHQGQTRFTYAIHTGALATGEQVSVRVSTLSAANATRKATVCAPALAIADEGTAHAPIYRWPVQKKFNDVPLAVGWSNARHAYQGVMTNEDGGTAEQCGGGAAGMQAEIARWGRSTDIEGHFSYGGAAPTWERCTGTVPTTTTALRMEGAHPILYYGDGHNRLFEHRGGYGQTCGTAAPEKPDGDLSGWNTADPSTALADDDGKVIVLRPVPFDLDALGYDHFGGRREALADHYAPWLYRVASLELQREAKVDDARTFGMERYLYADVRVADVGGSGDGICSVTTSGGFKLRAITKGGAALSSAQITGDYAANGNHDWKRVAIPVPAGTTAADIDHFDFDAYDGDGIYVTALGDAFIPAAAGRNGATLDYVRRGEKAFAVYVDDNNDGCTNGVNTDGPGGTPYRCAGSLVSLPL